MSIRRTEKFIITTEGNQTLTVEQIHLEMTQILITAHRPDSVKPYDPAQRVEFFLDLADGYELMCELQKLLRGYIPASGEGY